MAAPSRRDRPGLRTVVSVAAVMAVITLGLLATPLACTTTIVPPTVTGHVVTVYLVDRGRTPELALPRPDGGYDRWVFGEYRWYALRQTGPWRGVQAMLWPTRGGLGRATVDDPADVEARLQRVGKIYPIRVDAAAAEALSRELSALFDAGSPVSQPDGDFMFVHHPRAYTYFSNSNHQTADWLGRLSCGVRGPAFYSRWAVKTEEP